MTLLTGGFFTARGYIVSVPDSVREESGTETRGYSLFAACMTTSQKGSILTVTLAFQPLTI